MCLSPSVLFLETKREKKSQKQQTILGEAKINLNICVPCTTIVTENNFLPSNHRVFYIQHLRLSNNLQQIYFILNSPHTQNYVKYLSA